MLKEKDESSVYYPHVSSEDREEIVPFSGSDSKVVCPQEYLSGIDYCGPLLSADYFLCGASLNLFAVDCVVRAGTAKLFSSGLSEGCVMEADTAGPLSFVLFVDSPDAKSQMAILIQNSVSVRAAYKAIRKRVRVEARRQRELEEVLQRCYMRVFSSCWSTSCAFHHSFRNVSCQGCKAPSC